MNLLRGIGRFLNRYRRGIARICLIGVITLLFTTYLSNGESVDNKSVYFFGIGGRLVLLVLALTIAEKLLKKEKR